MGMGKNLEGKEKKLLDKNFQRKILGFKILGVKIA